MSPRPTRLPSTGSAQANPTGVRPPSQSLRSTAAGVPFSDPSYIPGLAPAVVVGPPVPMAPEPPARSMALTFPSPVQETVFAYDATVKEATLEPGQTTVHFTFHLTNTSPHEVTINAVRTSCGCTVPKLPAVPWKLASMASGSFDVALDARGAGGIMTKSVTIDSTAGYRYLTVRALIPTSASPAAAADRARNLQIALADRQAVFKGDCAACHLQPALAQYGQALFKTACGICHEAEPRAAMVPDLRATERPSDRDYWGNWIAKGKPGTLMPAFAIDEHGFLSSRQIDSLVDYLTGPFRVRPAASPDQTKN